MTIVPVFPSGMPTNAEWEAELVSYGAGDGNGNLVDWQSYPAAQWLNKCKLELQRVCTSLGEDPDMGYGSVSGLFNRHMVFGTATPTIGTHYLSDKVWDTAVTGGGTMGWVCTSAGTNDTISTLGSITAGTYDITITGTMEAQVPGRIIDIAGVTGKKVILSIDGTTVSLTTTADATVVDAAVTNHAPTWKTFGTITA